MKTITGTDYHTDIDVHVSVQKAFDAICRVSAWWTENTEGSTVHLNDEFTVRFGETFRSLESSKSLPAQKLVWHVLDCNLHWI
ncbi:MAG: hypothetical protein WDM78_14765 [Puia sp.]